MHQNVKSKDTNCVQFVRVRYLVTVRIYSIYQYYIYVDHLQVGRYESKAYGKHGTKYTEDQQDLYWLPSSMNNYFNTCI